MNLSDIVNAHPKIYEAFEIVGIYGFRIEGVKQILKIKVYKYDNGSFSAYPNLLVKGKGCASPHQSINSELTKEKAIKKAIDVFFTFFSEDSIIIEASNW